MLKRLRDLFGRRTPAAPAAPETRDRDGDVAAARRPAPVGDGKARPPVHHGPRVAHQPIAAADLDPDAVKIVKRLTRFDHTAYLVGGCVRDLLLDRRPKDFDIGTSATPRQIKRVFRNSRIIGRRFRLAHIYFQSGKIIEVATFRAHDEQEGDDAEGDLLIRDDNVFGTPEEDALRRDFTINALFYDVNNETVLDHAGGLDDLRRRLVRTIGDPEIRFREDPIRILRAIKFAARLEFEIEPATLAALRRTRQEIPKAAPPRVLEELNRFCRGGAARRSFELMRETGTFEVVLPELSRDYDSPVAWQLLFEMLERLERYCRQARRDMRTGEIFAALLAWPVGRGLGWTAAGEARAARGLDLRRQIDERLRDLSLRLRIPRREQELCRQILLPLFRMVPANTLHRNTKRSILRRGSLEETLLLLDAAAAVLDGAVAEASAFWRDVAGVRPEDRPRESEGDEEAEGVGGERGGGRRRRRGGRRRKRGDVEPAAARDEGEREPARQKDEARRRPRKEMPPPWDERYFFAALPSVPEAMAEKGRARYGGDLAGDDFEEDDGDEHAGGPAPERDGDESGPGARGGEMVGEGAPDGASSAANASGQRPRRSRRGRRGGRRRRRDRGSDEPGSGTDGSSGGDDGSDRRRDTVSQREPDGAD